MALRWLCSILLIASALAVACRAPAAFGDRHSIIVRADADLWAQIDSTLMGALEQRVFTTRPERYFKVTFVASDDTLWNRLRLWQQVVVVGTRQDEAVQRLLRKTEDPDIRPPAVVEVGDVWARAQLVTLLLLPEEDKAEAAGQLIPELSAYLQTRYDGWITERMYTSGVNDSLKQALADFGFTLDLPRVYLYAREDSVFRFANAYQQGESDLLRSLLLTWTPGSAAATPESLRAWREHVSHTYYEPPQDVLDQDLRVDSVEVAGLTGLELRGVWQDRAEFPAAGPFVTRAIVCPAQDRTYLIDAWLFAPGQDKYPYLRQLEIILGTFRCDGVRTARAGAEPSTATSKAG